MSTNTFLDLNIYIRRHKNMATIESIYNWGLVRSVSTYPRSLFRTGTKRSSNCSELGVKVHNVRVFRSLTHDRGCGKCGECGRKTCGVFNPNSDPSVTSNLR
jgi:hypothetical protein